MPLSPGQLSLFTAAGVILILLGFFITRLVCSRSLSPVLAWALAPVVGAGVCSVIAFGFRRPMFTIEWLLLIACSVAWYLESPRSMPERWYEKARVPLLTLVLAAALGWVLDESIAMVAHLPNGGTDGWGIWNSHARFVFRDGPNWRAHIVNSVHADYPLLVPLLHARIWRYAGESTDLSGLWEVLFGLAGVTLLTAFVARLRGATAGIIMGLVLLGTPIYLQSAAGQDADVPLSIFYLAAVSLLILASEQAEDAARLLTLAGFMAGCAAWTKNEGLLFVAATSTVLLAPLAGRTPGTLRRFGRYTLGLALPLLAVMFFKLTNPAQTYLFQSRQYAEVMAKLTDPSRYALIASQTWHTLRTFGHWESWPMIPLLAFVLLAGVNRKCVRSAGWLSSVAVLGMVACGYFAIYVITPMDLRWHLDTSLERLMMQLWPPTLCVLAAAMRGTTIPLLGQGGVAATSNKISRSML
jgi:hypothetical protein